MAELNARQLRLKNTEVLLITGEYQGRPEGIGRTGDLPEPMEPGRLAEYVKAAMELPAVRCYGKGEKKIRRAAVSGGSGKSVVEGSHRRGGGGSDYRRHRLSYRH